jgi:predicted nucleotidyltransferase
MDIAETPVTVPGIQKIVRQIVDRFHPQKVMLFGSYAYGQPTVDSDVDLLVVMETAENPMHMAGLISASIDHPFPIDILVMTPSRLEAHIKEKASSRPKW